jgi:hypothetical protein
LVHWWVRSPKTVAKALQSRGRGDAGRTEGEGTQGEVCRQSPALRAGGRHGGLLACMRRVGAFFLVS